jgi:hypothetical protein
MSNKSLLRENKKSNESSATTSSSNHIIQNGKGLLSFIFGPDASNYASCLILDAFETKNIPIALFVINNALSKNVKLDMNKRDSNERTILHWLVSTSAFDQFAKKLLFDILNTPGISKYINNQDKAGNTVAHIALYISENNNVDMDDIISFLIKRGIDLSIKNSEGRNITLTEIPVQASDSEKSESNITINNIFIKKSDKEDREDKKEKKTFKISESDAVKIAENLVKNYVMRTDEDNETINFNRNTETTVEEPKRKDDTKVELNKNGEKKKINFGGSMTQSEDSIEIIRDLVNGFKKSNQLNNTTRSFQKKAASQLGGASKVSGVRNRVSYSEQESPNESRMNLNNTMDVVDRITKMKTNNSSSSMSSITISSSYNLNKKGGASESIEDNIAKGKESDSDSESTNTTSSDITSSSTSDEIISDSTSSDETFSGGELDNNLGVNSDQESEALRNLSRLEDNEHSRALKKIQEILKVDEETAKIYRAILWDLVNKEMKGESNKARSQELEKRSSDEKVLKKINSKEIDEMKKKRITEENTKKEKVDDKKSMARFIDTLSDDLKNSEASKSEETEEETEDEDEDEDEDDDEEEEEEEEEDDDDDDESDESEESETENKITEATTSESDF